MIFQKMMYPTVKTPWGGLPKTVPRSVGFEAQPANDVVLARLFLGGLRRYTFGFVFSWLKAMAYF